MKYMRAYTQNACLQIIQLETYETVATITQRNESKMNKNTK